VLDACLISQNTERPHHGRRMNGSTPAHAFRDGIPKTTTRKETATAIKTAA
jgi:hypothetical protein